ncbi:hypothetical protein QTP88_018854 [Uroleucon formosanum]
MGFDQQLQSGVPPLPENLSPGMYTQSRMPNQPVPMQRTMRLMMRPTMSPNMFSPIGPSSLKRPLTTMKRGSPPVKRTNLDRNFFTTTLNKTPQIAKSIAESLTKSATKNSAPPASQQDVVNLFFKRGLTISTMEMEATQFFPLDLA